MSISPNDLQIKSTSTGKKYIELISEKRKYYITLGIYNSQHKLQILIDKSTGDIEKNMSMLFKSHNLLSFNNIISDIADLMKESYELERKNVNKDVTSGLLYYKKQLFSRWLGRSLYKMLNEVIESHNLDPEIIPLHRKLFAVLGPAEYAGSSVAVSILRYKNEDSTKYELLYNHIVNNNELSNITIYLITVFGMYQYLNINNLSCSNELAIESIYDWSIRNINSSIINTDNYNRNKKIILDSIRTIPTALPLDCIEYLPNLSYLTRPISGRIEYKYFLSDNINGMPEQFQHLTKSEITYLTKCVFGDKIKPTFENIKELRNILRREKPPTLNQFVLKVKLGEN